MTNQPSAEAVTLATALLPRALTEAEVLFATELLQAVVRAPDPRTAALVAALEEITDLHSYGLSDDARKMTNIAANALDAYDDHASNPATAQVAGEGV